MARYTPPTFNEGSAPGLSAAIMQAIADGVEEAQDYTPPGVIYPYIGTTAPTGFLLFDNVGTYSKTTYADLWALAGTGGTAVLNDEGGDLFSTPDWRGRYLMGVATSGTGSTIGDEFGSIDHVHTDTHTHPTGTLAIVDHPAHTHAGPSHQHDRGNHSHAVNNHSHTDGSLAADSAGSHGHGDSFSTGTSSNVATVDRNLDGLTALVQNDGHTHAVNGSVSSGGGHGHGVSGSTGTKSGLTTTTSGSGLNDASGTAATGDPSATLTHPFTGGVGTPSAAMGSQNPPSAAVTWICKF